MPSLQEHANAFYATLDAQDSVTLRALVTPDVAIQLGSAAPISFGAWEASLRMFSTGFPDEHHVVDDSIADDDRVVTRCQLEGTHSGELASIPPRGAKVSVGAIHIDRYRDEKVIEHVGQLDMHGLLHQVTDTSDESLPEDGILHHQNAHFDPVPDPDGLTRTGPDDLGTSGLRPLIAWRTRSKRDVTAAAWV